MNKVRFGNSVIEYSVVKSRRRKTSEIIVDKNGVLVRAPSSKPTSEIKNIVKEKSKWIYKKQLQFNTISQLKITNKKYSEQFLKRRVQFYASKIGVQPKKIVIKKLKSRWGSATKDHVINLNVNLAKAPKIVIDYVIIHELCHLKIREHSFKYWNLVRKFIPNYENQKLWLDLKGMTIL